MGLKFLFWLHNIGKGSCPKHMAENVRLKEQFAKNIQLEVLRLLLKIWNNNDDSET